MTVEALRRRRPEALEDLLAMYGREIQAVAFLILRDRASAEDVVVETLLTAFDRIGSLRNERAVRSWLLRIATNHALGMRRRDAKVVQLHALPERGGLDFGASSTDRVALLAGLEDLPPAMRAAVVLRYYAGLSEKDVAAAIGRRPGTVKSRLFEARRRLAADPRLRAIALDGGVASPTAVASGSPGRASQGGRGADSSAIGAEDNAARRGLGAAQQADGRGDTPKEASR